MTLPAFCASGCESVTVIRQASDSHQDRISALLTTLPAPCVGADLIVGDFHLGQYVR